MVQLTGSSSASKQGNLKRLASCLAAVASLLFADSAAAQTVSYNFNDGAADYMDTFVERGFGTATYFTAGGILNSGSIRGPGATSSASIYETPFANGPGASFTLSIEFLGGIQPTTDQGDVVGLGLLSTSDFGWQSSQPDHYFYNTVIHLNNSGGQNLTRFDAAKGGPTGGSGGGIALFTPMLTTDNWYRLTVTYTNTGSDFGIGISLYDIGAAGVSTPALVQSSSTNANLPGLAAAPSIYTGIYGGTVGGQTQQAKRLDGFTAVGTAPVPEPGTVALVALGGVALLLVRRRSRR